MLSNRRGLSNKRCPRGQELTEGHHLQANQKCVFAHPISCPELPQAIFLFESELKSTEKENEIEGKKINFEIVAKNLSFRVSRKVHAE